MMDEMENLVAETFKHYFDNYGHLTFEETNKSYFISGDNGYELPASPGLLYNIQKTSSVFVVRSFVSKNIKEDFQIIVDNPEQFPSLRLLEGGENDEVNKKLRYFIVDDYAEAEVIHDQVANRRFPMNEEMICNLSDPGFSWWLLKNNTDLQLSFNISISSGDAIKLGPLGDQQMALKNFQEMQSVFSEAGLSLNIQNELNRVIFSDGEELLLDELKDLFELGVIGNGLIKVFKLLTCRISDDSRLESLWYFLVELANLRRFWIQVQYDLDTN